MNKFLSKITPEWALRAGLGVMYVYSGIDIIRHPNSWFWAVRPLFKWFPATMQASLSVPAVMTKYLIFQGIGELGLALLLLGWFFPKYLVKWSVVLSVLEFVVILMLIPIDAITFRDIGLLGAFVALWLILQGDFAAKPNNTQAKKGYDWPKPEIKLGGPSAQSGEPKVETFDEFMGNQSK